MYGETLKFVNVANIQSKVHIYYIMPFKFKMTNIS